MRFAPDGTYRWGLLVGLVAALTVLFVALRPPALRVRRSVATRNLPRIVSLFIGLGVLFILGPWGVLAWGLAVLALRRASLPVVAFSAVSLAVLLSTVWHFRPPAVVVVLQGCALAIAWAAVMWAGWPVATAGAGAGRNGSSAEPGAR